MHDIVNEYSILSILIILGGRIMQLAIVDDELIFCNLIQNKIVKEFPCEGIDIYCDSISYLKSSKKYDITILDIQMPGIDGIELSKKIADKTRIIIFVTSIKERMQEAFGLKVFSFILKEEIDVKLIPMLKEATMLLRNRMLDFSTKSEDILIDMQDIYYIQIENRKNYLYTRDKEYKIMKKPLVEIFEMLNNDFAYSSQSCIVNMKHISKREKTAVELDNGTRLTISKKYSKAFKLHYMRSNLYE